MPNYIFQDTLSVGFSNAGVTLNGQFYSQSAPGTPSGPAITTGYTNLGAGLFFFEETIPMGQRGYIIHYSSSASAASPLGLSTIDGTLEPTTILSGNDADAATILQQMVTLPQIKTALAVPAAGVVIAGSTASSVVLSGLPAGRNYTGQRLYHQSGEIRVIASQSFSSSLYTFNMGIGLGELGPFSTAPTAGDVMYPIS